MNDEQKQKYTELELKQARKTNDKTAQQIGRLSLDNASLSARVEILEEENEILAQHIEQQAEKLKQYEVMLNIQNGDDPDVPEVLESAEEVKQQPPVNREQRRHIAKQKDKKG